MARLRVYGEVVADWDRLRERGDVDLAAVEHGGTVIACSDMFFGSRHNLIMPGPSRGMADGWETKRRRTPGCDWTIVRLGRPVRNLDNFRVPGGSAFLGVTPFDDRWERDCKIEAPTGRLTLRQRLTKLPVDPLEFGRGDERFGTMWVDLH